MFDSVSRRRLAATAAPTSAVATGLTARSAIAAVVATAAIATIATIAPPLRADELPRAPANADYQRECGDCHVAYPPALLSTSAWRQIMGQLDRHYGVDASLDAATAASISGWLERHGATRGKFAVPPRSRERYADRPIDKGTMERPPVAGETPPRLTETAWFRHEHDETPASARRNAGSMARCDACHRDAGKGGYSEQSIRFPQKAQGGQS